MDVSNFPSELTLVADNDELRITGPLKVCYALKDYLHLKGLATGVLLVINQGTDTIYSTAEFAGEGKTGDEVKELVESFLLEKNIKAKAKTIRNPDGFETIFDLVDISVFRPN